MNPAYGDNKKYNKWLGVTVLEAYKDVVGKVGKRADLVFVDDMFNVQNVMLAGQLQQFD